MDTNYQYIYFNIPDANRRKKDPNGYNTICLADLEGKKNVKVVSFPVDWAPTWLRFVFSAHTTPKINKRLPLPGKKLWYKHYFHAKLDKNKPLCFVIANFELPISYLRYLKKKYPTSKMVIVHRDLIDLFKIRHPNFTKEIVEELFDLSYSYDLGDVEKYECRHFNEIESKLDIPKSKEYPLCDVFFAGRAKDRLPMLMEVYHKLTAAGLSCNYYLTGVPQEQRIPFDGIEYADKNISYKEMLYRTVNARCLLDINQEGAVGYTSRFIEAILYNKKLLTNNLSVLDSKFYTPDNICCFEKAEQIQPEFVRKNCEEVEYNYQGEFSPIGLIQQIDKDLTIIDEKAMENAGRSY